ncbi:acyl carrier protein [Streptomyces sp. C11-1]|uniref:Acyl carrier protein n=1 Tax=Streptomyces durocortorensis TaxID=2811104 RepID=A0ABY9VQH1_9ACTN|nr:acyl carrier protein [Streptomyces durocortorensis]WNF25379.1 acyl carrier protein [Streptomyces durocortorensis]
MPPRSHQEYAITTAHLDRPDAAPEPLTGWLSSLITELLGLDGQLPADQPLGEIGIDSLTAAQLSVEVEERTGAYVALERFLGDETLDDLVASVADGVTPRASA